MSYRTILTTIMFWLCTTLCVQGQNISDGFTSEPIPDAIWQKMQGKTYVANPHVSRSDLRYLRVKHWDYDEQTFAVKTVGNDEFGYIQIPEDWFLDEDFAALSDDIITYENEPYILNGGYAMDSMIMDKCDAGMAHSKVESILREAESDQSVTEVAYEYPEVDGREAVFIEFKYDDLNKLRYTLLIGNEEQTVMHVITYESSNPKVVDLLRTFTREAPEGMSTDTTGTGDSTATTTSGTGTDTDTSSDTTTTATTTEAAG